MVFKEIPYKRADFNQFKETIEQLIEKQKNAKNAQEQFEIHKEYYELTNDFGTMSNLASIHYDMNTTDEFYEKERAYYDEMLPAFGDMQLKYALVLYHSPYRNELEEIIGKVAFKNIEIQLKAFHEKLIPLMQEENALTTEYRKLISSAKIDWNGETLNLSMLGKYMISTDRETRKLAHAKRSAWMKENSEALDMIYDKLVKNRTKQAQELGYKNFVELGYYRMGRNCYDAEQVKAFRDQVKSYLVPFVGKLQERRRNRLGLDKLYAIDENVYFNNGNPAPIGTSEDIMANGMKMYTDLSKDTKEFFEFMTQHELFDLLTRPNKSGGGYMTYLPNYKAPFVFANFNGTSADIDVITHECGHAFQGYISAKDPIIEHLDITMETAEIHSMSMEFFTEKYMELFFGDRANDYRSMHLEDAAAFIPYGCCVDEFQHVVYENPDMTPAERKQAWRKLEKEYKPYLDYGDDEFMESGAFWQKQSHIYEVPFYYIDYCLAQICALQYKVWMDNDYRKAFDSYLQLCQLSASDFFTNMIQEVGLKSPFATGTIKSIVERLEEKLEIK